MELIDTSKLKQLGLAYRIANEYDYVPQEDKTAQEIFDDYGYGTVEEIQAVLDEYNGWSCYDITEGLLTEIEGL